MGEWIPIEDRYPDVDEYGCSKYILISFANYSLPVVGRYQVDDESGGNFYEGDDDKSLLSYGLFVNAWMDLPKNYDCED